VGAARSTADLERFAEFLAIGPGLLAVRTLKRGPEGSTVPGTSLVLLRKLLHRHYSLRVESSVESPLLPMPPTRGAGVRCKSEREVAEGRAFQAIHREGLDGRTMNSFSWFKRLCIAVLLGATALGTTALAQNTAPADVLVPNYSEVTDARLLTPEPQNWLIYKGNYSQHAYSPLDQITPERFKPRASLDLFYWRNWGP